MRKNRRTLSRDDVLRLSWWVALALLVLVLLTGVLDGPVSRWGGDDEGELALSVHWVPVGLLAFMAVVSFLRSGARHPSAPLSAPYPTRGTSPVTPEA